MSIALPKRSLGDRAIEVSTFGLGTMTFGSETTKEEAFRQMDSYFNHGGNFLDTADVYSGGASEAIIGEWAQSRDVTSDIIIATKGRFAPPEGHFGASKHALRFALEGSLERLKRDAVDLYIVHGWDKDTPILETLEALEEFRRGGLIKHTGWSNLCGWQLQQIVEVSKAHGFPSPISLQPQYNLLERGAELELIPCCIENGVSLTPWSPLGGGWLTGKYTASEFPAGATRLGEDPERGVEAYALRNQPRTYEVLSVMQSISEKYDRPISHIALAWLKSRPNISSILLGCRSNEQLLSNLAAADFGLSADEISWLSEVSAFPKLIYPYNFLEVWVGIAHWRGMGTAKKH